MRNQNGRATQEIECIGVITVRGTCEPFFSQLHPQERLSIVYNKFLIAIIHYYKGATSTLDLNSLLHGLGYKSRVENASEIFANLWVEYFTPGTEVQIDSALGSETINVDWDRI